MSEDAEDLMRILGSLRGGSRGLYKPCVEVTFYEHDEIVTVRVGRCKGMDEVVYERRGASDFPKGQGLVARALHDAISTLRATGAS